MWPRKQDRDGGLFARFVAVPPNGRRPDAEDHIKSSLFSSINDTFAWGNDTFVSDSPYFNSEDNRMDEFSSLADDFYVNMNLNTEMPLPQQRETILSFFERIQKTYPTMRNFYTRDTGDFVLEEDKEHNSYRWISIEPRRVCSGYVNPPNRELAMDQHKLVLELIPYMLSVSPMDCEALDFMLGFDFNYKGNHDALVAEALGTSSAMDGMVDFPDARVINYEPAITISLDDSCRLQARLMIETRTSAYHVRRDDYPEEQISVYFTTRKYGSLEPGTTFDDTLDVLRERNDHLLKKFVIDEVLNPLKSTISTK